MIAVASLRVSLSASGSRMPSRIRSSSGRPVAFSSTLPRMTKLVCAYDQHAPGSQMHRPGERDRDQLLRLPMPERIGVEVLEEFVVR